MRILDRDNDEALKNVVVYLTKKEAKEMLGDLKRLVDENNNNDHAHINDIEYKHEITITVYEGDNLQGFDERSKKLINDDV